MYRAIIKRIAKKNFERVNQRDFASLLKDCVPNVCHRFSGNHALGGSGTTARPLAAGSTVRKDLDPT